MRRMAIVAFIVAAGITAVSAQSDPIASRKALMKSVNDQNRAATEMLDGKRPFDATAAKAVLTTFADVAAKMPALFPENSKTGDTAALPAVWENKADFEAKMAAFGSASKAAADQVTSLDTFKANLTDVRKSCGGCHQTYRKRT